MTCIVVFSYKFPEVTVLSHFLDYDQQLAKGASLGEIDTQVLQPFLIHTTVGRI